MAMSSKASSSRSAMHSDVPYGRRLLTGLALATLLAGCDGGSSLNEDDDTFHIRSLNLVEDSPTLEIDLDETTIATFAYGNATSFSAAHPGRHDISFAALLPGDLDDDDDDDETSVDVGQSVSYTFLGDTDYTLVAYGTVSNPQTFLVEGFGQRDSVEDDRVILQVTHAAPALGDVDVYVTAVQAGIATRQYVDTLSMTETTTPLTLTLTRDDDDLDDDSTLTADLVIELVATATGQSVYRSKSISVAEKNRLLLAIANVNGPGPAAVKLVGAGGSSGDFLARTDGAALRFMHASHDTPPLDVTVGSGFADPLATNVGFRQSSGYTAIDDGEVGMIAVPTGSPGVFAFLEEFVASAGQYYTAYAIGPRTEVDAVVVTADARSVPTQTRFRFLHAAGSLQDEDPLDIYLREPGGTVDFDDDDTVPDSSSVGYQSTTSYVTLVQGDYEAWFAVAGTSTVLLGPAPFHVGNGEVTTLLLVDDENGALELLPLNDTRN